MRINPLQIKTSLTESCPSRLSSSLASTETSRGAVTADVSATQPFDRRPVTPPSENLKGYRTGFDGAESHNVALTSQQHEAQDGEAAARQSDGGASLSLFF